MSDTRIEKDSMGELEVPATALFGAQTQRAINNFPVSGQPMPEPFIRALILAKQAAAIANKKLAQLETPMANAIVDACDSLLSDPRLMQHFPVDIFQTGSGTSSNMNANEVIATLASKASGLEVRPNDHINYGQSSNDIIPTTIHISATIEIESRLLPSLEHLKRVIDKKSGEVAHHIKTGRTHLMDAMPVSMAQSLSGWSSQVELNIDRLNSTLGSLKTLAQGGTAVGTGINAHKNFPAEFCKALNEKTEYSFSPAENFFSHIGSQDIAVAVSGQLKSVAVTTMKIANDLRWMNSGPLAGLAEIELEALQPGSSIMPGKVNPVIPEAAAMAAAKVIGNDATITIGGQSGNFELNVMLPVIASCLLDSINLLATTSRLLADKAVASFKVNEDKIKESLAKNPILVTALNSKIGYLKAAEIARQAYKEKRPIIEVAAEQTTLSKDELETLLDPRNLIG